MAASTNTGNGNGNGECKKIDPLELREKCGYSLIPLRQFDKRPAIGWKKYQSIKATLAEVRSWMGKGFNWGIVTGLVSGIVALDLDNRAATRLEEFLPYPHQYSTPVVKTPRGYHIYYQHPGEGNLLPNRSLKALEIDFRGDGGFVVIPPSVNFTGQHWVWEVSPLEARPKPMPESVLQLLR